MIYPKENWLTDDEHGIQMPWYVRPCLEVIDKWDLRGKYIFEYGVGYSTLWYRSRGAHVIGVDSNKEWAALAKSSYHTEKENYIQSIMYVENGFNGKIYDIVVIDGLYRDECTARALFMLNSGGKLIIDNWEQPSADLPEWPKTKELIKGMEIEIYKEPTHQDWKTAIITKP